MRLCECRSGRSSLGLWKAGIEINLRVRISAARYGMKPPAEGDAIAVVQDLEDGEVLRDYIGAGSLSSFLLVDQILFAIDRGSLRS